MFSVPENRTRTRPSAPSAFSTAAMARPTPGQLRERPLLADHDVHERLRHRLEAPRQLGQRPPLSLHHREHVERRGDAVAGRHVVEEDEVARLLAAEVVAAAAHLLDDVTIPDRGAHDPPLHRRERALEADVRHHRRDHRPLRERALADEVAADERHDRVAVHHPPLLVREDHPVGVAVEGEPEVRAVLEDRARHPLGVERAAAVVDVLAVRLDAERDHLRAELLA